MPERQPLTDDECRARLRDGLIEWARLEEEIVRLGAQADVLEQHIRSLVGKNHLDCGWPVVVGKQLFQLTSVDCLMVEEITRLD